MNHAAETNSLRAQFPKGAEKDHMRLTLISIIQ